MTNLHEETINYHSGGSPVNDLGLLATLYNHKIFLNSVKPAFDKEQEKRQ